MNLNKHAINAASVCLLAAASFSFTHQANAQSEGDIDRAATLRYAWSAPAADFDPPFAKNPYQLMGYALPIYDTLVRLDAKGGIVPSLATSWSFSDDGMTLTMKIRDGVKFTDGSDLNAGVIVRSLNRTKTEPGSLLQGQLASFESFAAPDPSTVVLKLKRRDAGALFVLTSGAGMIVSGKALDDGVKLGTTPVGTGPYKLVSAGPQGATYERNDNYFDKSQNQFAKLVLQTIGDDKARLNSVLTGQSDIGLFQGEQTILTRAKQMAEGGKFTSYAVPSINSLPMYLNSKIPPLDNPKVRLALNMAIDRAAISAAIQNGECTPASQPLPPGVVGHDPALTAYKLDVAKAKALLQEAGVQPFTFDVLVTTQEPFASIGVLLKEQLQAIGATMNIIPTDGVAGRPMFRSGKYPSFIGAFSAPSPDSESVIDSSFLTPDTPGGIPAEWMKAIDDARTKLVGTPEREAAYKAISKMAYENPQHLTVCWSPILVVARKGIVGAEKAPYLRALAMADIRNYAALKAEK